MQPSSQNRSYYTYSKLRRRTERKIQDVLEEDQFGFRRGKGTRNATGMMRIIAERTLEIDEEICVCFIEWQKAFDRVNRTKLMQILKRTESTGGKEDLLANFTWIRGLKYDLTKGRQEVWRF